MTKKAKKRKKGLIRLLDGSFLINENTIKRLPFLSFIAILAFVYITNVLTAEKKRIQISQSERRINDLEAILNSVNIKLYDNTRPTVIIERLEHRGFKKNTEAYYIIENDR